MFFEESIEEVDGGFVISPGVLGNKGEGNPEEFFIEDIVEEGEVVCEK